MKTTIRTLAIPAALAAFAVAAPVAGARGPKAPKETCGNPAGERVFAQFKDRRDYFLAPDGGFEGGAAEWLLDGASVVDGNESFNLAGADHSKSLSLPAGSSATSPEFCVEKRHPIFRFVAKRTSGGKKARLKVQVVYSNGRKPRTAGKLRAGEAWKPTKKLAIAIGKARAKRSAIGHVKLRFTPIGDADWQIDDVFIDPRARR